MRAVIRPVHARAKVAVRALTLQSVDVYEPEANIYEHEIAAVDSLKPGDVMAASTQQSTRTCLLGELLSTSAMARGAKGTIIDGYTRDVLSIQKMQFPVFSTGIYTVDSVRLSAITPRSTVVASLCVPAILFLVTMTVSW